jgi:hypothetical protein
VCSRTVSMLMSMSPSTQWMRVPVSLTSNAARARRSAARQQLTGHTMENSFSPRRPP